MRSIAWMLAAALVAACGSNGSTGGGAADDGGANGDVQTSDSSSSSDSPDTSIDAPQTPSVGQTTGESLQVLASLDYHPAYEGTPSQAAFSVQPQIPGSSAFLEGATVTVTPFGGQPIALGWTTGSRYAATVEQDLAPSYEISVTHPLGTRTGIIMLAPSLQSGTIAPAPKVDAVSTFTWTPSNEPDVQVYLHAGAYTTLTATPLPDTGSFDLPATAFKSAGGSSAYVARFRTFTVPKQVTTNVIVTVWLPPFTVEP